MAQREKEEKKKGYFKRKSAPYFSISGLSLRKSLPVSSSTTWNQTSVALLSLSTLVLPMKRRDSILSMPMMWSGGREEEKQRLIYTVGRGDGMRAAEGLRLGVILRGRREGMRGTSEKSDVVRGGACGDE